MNCINLSHQISDVLFLKLHTALQKKKSTWREGFTSKYRKLTKHDTYTSREQAICNIRKLFTHCTRSNVLCYYWCPIQSDKSQWPGSKYTNTREDSVHAPASLPCLIHRARSASAHWLRLGPWLAAATAVPVVFVHGLAARLTPGLAARLASGSAPATTPATWTAPTPATASGSGATPLAGFVFH